MVDKLFSIIIPTYNRSNLLIETLKSVRSQTYRPIEILVIDDGSTDATKNVVAECVKSISKSSGISLYYIYQNNMGPAVARNLGLVKSAGEYVLFLDSDDCLYPQCLDVFSFNLKEKNADMAVSGYDVIKNGSRVDRVLGQPNKNQLELVLKGDLVVFPLRVVLTRNLLEKVGLWNVNMDVGEDREFLERALCFARNPIGIQEVLGFLRRGLLDHRSRNYSQACRVLCEESLLKNVCCRSDLNKNAVDALLSRITRIGCRLNAANQPELGMRCGKIVSQCGASLSLQQRVTALLCRLGKTGGNLYNVISWILRK